MNFNVKSFCQKRNKIIVIHVIARNSAIQLIDPFYYSRQNQQDPQQPFSIQQQLQALQDLRARQAIQSTKAFPAAFKRPRQNQQQRRLPSSLPKWKL